jgi:photosystem II stability/assembly factor-like uncharacterized protein
MKFYILAFLLIATVLSYSLLADSHPDLKTQHAGTAKIVFKSTDGGQTWQDISKGLPKSLQNDGIRGDSIFATNKGLLLKVGSESYLSTPTTTAPFWTKETSPDDNRSIAPGKSGILAYSYWGVHLKTKNGTSVWSPMFENIDGPRIRSTFETVEGTLFLGTDSGIFKTENSGKTWKLVYTGGLVGHLAESNGVLLATSMRKIIRSTDNGENWETTISEDSAAFDIKPIKYGFVAITAASESATRRLSTSFDGGKTWQSIHSVLQDKVTIDSIWRTWNDRPLLKAFQTSITQVGENLLSIHPQGLFKSADKGKTWRLILPATNSKRFNLIGSGNVLYAISSKGGGGC